MYSKSQYEETNDYTIIGEIIRNNSLSEGDLIPDDKEQINETHSYVWSADNY
ncbi:MAG: hypothetical protein GX995_03470 [Clostridiales bacterium]|nr:hypothetical protein [Clostridiales bacterium]